MPLSSSSNPFFCPDRVSAAIFASSATFLASNFVCAWASSAKPSSNTFSSGGELSRYCLSRWFRRARKIILSSTSVTFITQKMS
jgi:hypothetical protein